MSRSVYAQPRAAVDDSRALFSLDSWPWLVGEGGKGKELERETRVQPVNMTSW